MDSNAKEVEASVRGICAGRLPAYMVPSQVVLLESLPRTASGKAWPKVGFIEGLRLSAMARPV